jgi:RNA polymerase sigma-70 factor (ECF subfamily)
VALPEEAVGSKNTENVVAFPTTIWEKVAAALGSREALGELLERYQPPLQAHLIWEKKLNPEAAEEVLQGFVTEKVLERELLSRADRSRGKFRTFLLSALNHYLIDQRRAQQAAKAAPARALAMDTEQLAEQVVERRPEPPVFELAWAFQVLGESFRRLHGECMTKNRPDLWGVFEGRALAPLEGEPPSSYRELAERWGFTSEKQAANAWSTVQNMHQRVLRSVLTPDAEGDLDREILDLKHVFQQAGPELLEELRKYLWKDLPEVTMATSNRSPLDPKGLGALFQLQSSDPPDPAAALRQLLTAPVLLDLGDVSPKLAQELRTWTERQGLLVKSLGDVLQHPNPSLELLRIVKQFAKDNRSNPDSPLPREVATVLYYASLAAALVRYGERITRHQDAALQKGFQWALEQSWVDDATKGLFQEGMKRLGSSSGAQEG